MGCYLLVVFVLNRSINLTSPTLLISSEFSDIGPKEFAALWTCLGQWRVSIISCFILSYESTYDS